MPMTSADSLAATAVPRRVIHAIAAACASITAATCLAACGANGSHAGGAGSPESAAIAYYKSSVSMARRGDVGRPIEFECPSHRPRGSYLSLINGAPSAHVSKQGNVWLVRLTGTHGGSVRLRVQHTDSGYCVAD